MGGVGGLTGKHVQRSESLIAVCVIVACSVGWAMKHCPTLPPCASFIGSNALAFAGRGAVLGPNDEHVT